MNGNWKSILIWFELTDLLEIGCISEQSSLDKFLSHTLILILSLALPNILIVLQYLAKYYYYDHCWNTVHTSMYFSCINKLQIMNIAYHSQLRAPLRGQIVSMPVCSWFGLSHISGSAVCTGLMLHLFSLLMRGGVQGSLSSLYPFLNHIFYTFENSGLLIYIQWIFNEWKMNDTCTNRNCHKIILEIWGFLMSVKPVALVEIHLS